MNEKVEPEGRITKDLEKTEEVLFTAIALNPSATADELRDKYGISRKRMSEVVDSLLDKGLVEPVSADNELDVVWRVPEKGRIRLLKYVEVLRFDVMEAELNVQSVDDVNKLKKKREFVASAYKQCKALFGGGD